MENIRYYKAFFLSHPSKYAESTQDIYSNFRSMYFIAHNIISMVCNVYSANVLFILHFPFILFFIFFSHVDMSLCMYVCNEFPLMIFFEFSLVCMINSVRNFFVFLSNMISFCCEFIFDRENMTFGCLRLPGKYLDLNIQKL